MCEFFREKYQIVVFSTFDQRELKKINYFDKNVYSEDIMKNQLKLMVSKKGGDRSHFGSNI